MVQWLGGVNRLKNSHSWKSIHMKVNLCHISVWSSVYLRYLAVLIKCDKSIKTVQFLSK